MLPTLKKYVLSLTLLTCVTLLSGCDLSDNNNSNHKPVILTPSASAVVQTIDPGYVSSEVLFLDPANQQVSSPYLSKTKSDYTLATNGKDIYHIGRSNIDTLDKYVAEDYYNAAWSFTTQDPSDSTSRNPYNLVFASDTKAYLIRYNSPKVWIVNPNAADFASFKIGEIDLSDYIPGNNSTTPSPATAVISQGKLFIAMQRLSDSWAPNAAYVAVFDTTTDNEIETNSDLGDGLKGIVLQGLNPLENSLVTGPDGKVYVTSHGPYTAPVLSNSRIEEIDPDTYALRHILTAANMSNNVSQYINASVIVSAEKGYFYAGEVLFNPYREISTLYEFNPTTGAIIASEVAGTGNEQISYLGLDKNGFLWLSIITPGTPGVDIIDSKTNARVGDRLLTELNPNVIRFLD
jgi:hypothetical protein